MLLPLIIFALNWCKKSDTDFYLVFVFFKQMVEYLCSSKCIDICVCVCRCPSKVELFEMIHCFQLVDENDVISFYGLNIIIST